MNCVLAYCLIIIAFWCLSAYLVGRQDLNDDGDAFVACFFASIVWPFGLVVGLFALIFTFLGELGQKHRVKS